MKPSQKRSRDMDGVWHITIGISSEAHFDENGTMFGPYNETVHTLCGREHMKADHTVNMPEEIEPTPLICATCWKREGDLRDAGMNV
jgi:hypothetical protein